MYDVRIAKGWADAPKVEAKLRKSVRAVLRCHRVRRAQISVALVDKAIMAKLNRRHLGRVGATDVLSFDLRDDMDEKGVIEGEIVISVDAAAREARRRGHNLEAELALYAVHGTLHLLGYDDRRKANAARMHEVEDRILSSIGFGTVYGWRREAHAS